ncbi:MAG TPA: amino acid adenylation domain-containing protein, partial [Ktedonobacteraceae bacterium]|nr:amino acid adenylation domain-containing protein [Ktedonobacteraceae bacterium]
ALARSLNEIVRRHEALRTRFDLQQNEPVQIIMPPSALPFPFVDLRGVSGAEQEVLLQRITADEGNRIFDLCQDPLISAVLLCFSTTEYVLLLCIHHIVCDGWSLNVFFRELTIVYEAFVADQPSPLPPLPLQYADYALWQREWLQGEVLKSHLSYWRQTLDGLAPLELPTDHPRPLIQTWRGVAQETYLPLALSQDLEAFSQSEGVTLFMTLLAAFQVLLWRYSGQEDIAVGTPIANRNRAESEDLIGCFVNTLVLRSNLAGNPSFQEFLQRVKETCLGAYAHQDLPFERIVEELQPERELSRSPLFQVLFALHNLPASGAMLPDLRVLPLEIELETVKFDLSLSLSETPRGLLAQLRYCSELFEAATMERMLRHWQRLLEGLVAHPEARLAELPLLAAEEEQQVLIEWNAPQEHYTLEGSLSHCFEVQAGRTPDAVALVSEEGCLTYGELNQRANQLASYLRDCGTGPEIMVGLWIEHSPELLIGVLGTLKAGAAYVPLDPNTPPERLRFLLQDASIRVLLTRLSLWEKLGRAEETRVLCLEELWERLGMEPGDEAGTRLPLEAAAYVLYTSGSTGQPKGVVVAHRQILNYVEAIRRRVAMRPEASYALLQPLTVDSSLTMLWGALLSGGRLLLIGKEQGLDAEELATVFAREPVDYLKIAPSHLAALLAAREPTRLLPRRALIIGGEVSHQGWAQEVAARMPEGRMYNHYGPTEAAVGVLTCPVEISEGTESVWGVHTPLGKPLGKSQMYVMDGHMQPVPVGVPGELYIGGEQVARGYLGRPELTAERFVPDPYSGEPGVRLYRTGDIVRYHADGVLDFIGRQDEQVKIRGYRVEPGEIEAVLSQHPQVREALVVTREAGAGEKHLVGYVTVEKENALLSQDVLRFVRERLPEYMVPVAIVTLKQWPRTPHGKIDRQMLPVPDMTQSLADEAPRTAVEALLAAIWAEMLGVDHVGIHDNFFDLGGDSILSIRVVARARQAGLNLTPRQLFQAQSIAGLAPLIDQQSQVQMGQWGMETGIISFTPIQHWFFEKRLPEPHHWNQPVQLKLADEIDETLLELAVRQVLKQHAILRAHCIQGADSWQLFLPEDTVNLPWHRIDLSMLAAQEQTQILEEQATHVQASLNLTASPLCCVALFDLGPERGRHLLWVMHHLLVDTVSWGILLEDLQLAYQCLQRGQVPRLPLPTTPFARWARLLREYAHSSELQAECAYWQDVCRKDIPAIPVDFPVEEGSNTEGLARIVEVSLTPEETRALLQEVPEVYRTHINDVLLTALVQSFARWTGEPRLLLQLEGHGREELFEDVDLTRSVGWFTVRFPVLLSLDTAGGKGYLSEPGEALVAVKEQLRRIPNHGIGYGVLRYYSQDKEAVADLQAFPSPQVSFNYFGRVDAGAEVSTLFEAEQNSFGRARSPRGERGYWLEINGQVVAGRLTLEWAYSERI